MNRGPIILVGIIIGLMGLLHLFAILSLPPEEPVKKTEAAPLFEVGDCIQLKKLNPEWDIHISRIMAIEPGGAYRTCQLGDHCADVLNGRLHPVLILFMGQEYYEKVSCGGL